MNELISTQRVRKRRRQLRLSPAHQKARSDGLEAFRKARFPAIAPVVAVRAALAVLSAAAFAVAAVALALPLVERSRLAALPQGDDPYFSRDMRAYAGVSAEAEAANDLPALDLAETFSFKLYTVKPGDTVSSIAARHSLTVGSLIATNGIPSAKGLRAGSILKIPNMDGILYTVRKGDSLSRIASAHGIPVEAILDANDLDSPSIHPGAGLFLPGARMSAEDLRRALGDLLVYPVRGRLTSSYGWRNDPFTGVRRFHAAIDLAAPEGTPVAAAMEGRVSVVGYNTVYGKYVIMTHSGGYQTWYAHLNEFRTEKGAYLKQGQRLGDVGSTGYSTGNHLHFAVFKNGRALNPLPLLSAR